MGAELAIGLSFDALQSGDFHNRTARFTVFFDQRIDHELTNHPADRAIIDTNPTRVVGFDDVALQADHRDVRRKRVLHDFRQRRTFIGRDDQELGLHPDGRLDFRDLPHAVLLGIHDDELHFGLFAPELLHLRILRRAIGFGIITLTENHRVTHAGRSGFAAREQPQHE